MPDVLQVVEAITKLKQKKKAVTFGQHINLKVPDFFKITQVIVISGLKKVERIFLKFPKMEGSQSSHCVQYLQHSSTLGVKQKPIKPSEQVCKSILSSSVSRPSWLFSQEGSLLEPFRQLGVLSRVKSNHILK